MFAWNHFRETKRRERNSLLYWPTYLTFLCSSFLPIYLKFIWCHFSSAKRTSFSISLNVVLLVINSLIFHLSENAITSPSYLKGTFINIEFGIYRFAFSLFYLKDIIPLLSSLLFFFYEEPSSVISLTNVFFLYIADFKMLSEFLAFRSLTVIHLILFVC